MPNCASISRVKLSLADAVAQIQRATHQFAKRQITWFRKEPEVHWLDSFGDSPPMSWATSVLALLRAPDPGRLASFGRAQKM